MLDTASHRERARSCEIVRDKLLLLISAAGLGALLLSGMFAVDALGLGQHWRMLWVYTILLFLVLVVTAVAEMKRRSRKVRRQWPLMAAAMVFLIGHVVVVSTVVGRVGGNWGMPQFFALSVVECVIFVLLFERAYALSVSRST